MTDPFADPDLRGCAQIVERGDPERFSAVMAASVAARVALFPVYAFNVEVTRAPWVTAEPMIAEMRLQWWHDTLGEIAAGGPVRRHEVATPLAAVLDAEGAAMLTRLVEARRWDVHSEPHADAAALSDYLGATGGSLMAAAARVLGDRDGHAARDAGWAVGLSAYLQAVPALRGQGRQPLPDDGPDAIRGLARDGLGRLDAARRAMRALPRAARPALLSGWLARPVLLRALHDPDHVAAGTLAPSEATQRWRRLWVAATGRL